MNNKLRVTARTPKVTERGSEKDRRAASTRPSALIAGKYRASPMYRPLAYSGGTEGGSKPSISSVALVTGVAFVEATRYWRGRLPAGFLVFLVALSPDCLQFVVSGAVIG